MKRRSLSKFRTGVKKAKRKNPEESASPPAKKSGLWSDLASAGTDFVLPGVAAYAGTRVAGRIAFAVARKKSPKLARHLVPISSVAAALGQMALAQKWDKLEPYQTGIMVGSGIAAVQSVIQTYLPHWGWILSDPNEDAARAALAQPVVPVEQLEMTYIEQLPGQDLGPGAGFIEATAPATAVPPITNDQGLDLDDFSDIPGMNGSLKTGIFAA